MKTWNALVRITIFGALFLLCVLIVQAQLGHCQQSAFSQLKFDQLIQQLGDDDFQKREQAQAAIIQMGEPAIKPLRQEEKKPDLDPEILRRVRQIIPILHAQFPITGEITEDTLKEWWQRQQSSDHNYHLYMNSDALADGMFDYFHKVFPKARFDFRYRPDHGFTKLQPGDADVTIKFEVSAEVIGRRIVFTEYAYKPKKEPELPLAILITLAAITSGAILSKQARVQKAYAVSSR